MASPGRKARTRNVHSITESAVPDELLLDTAFLYAALELGQAWHQECARFLERAATNRTVFFFNRLMEIELREVAYRGAFERRWNKDWRKHRYDGRTRTSATRQTATLHLAWNRFLDTNAHVRVELHEVDHLVDEHMALGLGSYDAVHASTGAYSSVKHIATLDASFALDTDLTIHIDPSRLSRCRTTRGGRGR